MYTLRTEQFEGPLELLLELIEKQKLSINQISLATIADEYLGHVKSMGGGKRGSSQVHPEEISSFLVIAATLMLIKSRSLLPNVEITSEEEHDIQELEQRLTLYHRFRELAHNIENLQKQGNRMYSRESYADFPVIFYPPNNFGVPNMATLVRQVIDALPKKEVLQEKTIRTLVSLEEKMEELKGRMQKAITHSFHHFVKGKSEKVEVIVSFLAMLELFKEGVLLVRQENLFEDITMERIES
jgi:segregation and condensation protein A